MNVPRHLTDEQLRKDCEFAGIPLRDETGAVLDFHAGTRHTFCTLLGKAGVAPHRQRLLARHADLSTTLRYTHLQVIDLVEGIEALPNLTAGEGVERADYLRNAGCSQAQSDARECNEGAVGAGASVEAEGNVKGLPVQDLATPCKAMQEVPNSLPTNKLWWRRRESNPRTVSRNIHEQKELRQRMPACGLYAEQNADNPFGVLAGKWNVLSPDVQAALRAFVTALTQRSCEPKKTGAS